MDITKYAVDHRYYCSESNFYSREPGETYQCARRFLDDWEDADEDMNLVFRWDIKPGWDDSEKEGHPKTWRAEVFIIHQRKGIFNPIEIKTITEEELPRFVAYLKRHWDVMQEIWLPLSLEGGDAAE